MIPTETIIEATYLIATALFILSLIWMKSPVTARRGVFAGEIGMALAIGVDFGWVFYRPAGLTPFLAILFFLGLAGGNFAIYSLWLPEQYPTAMRATAFAFCTSFGRFLGAAANFAIAAMIARSGSPGHVECAVCGKALANWTTPSFRAYRLELAPEHKYVRVPTPPSPVPIAT